MKFSALSTEHYALSTMHYALCTAHYALSTVHCAEHYALFSVNRAEIHTPAAGETIRLVWYIIFPSAEYHLVHEAYAQYQSNETPKDPSSLFKTGSDQRGIVHQLLKCITRFQEGLDIKVCLIIPEFGVTDHQLGKVYIGMHPAEKYMRP